MKTILEILNELKANSGKKAKAAIMQEHKDDQLFQTVCRLAYHPRITFGQKILPEAEEHFDTIDLDTALSQAENVLASREVTGHEAKGFLKNLLTTLSEDNAEVLRRVITKDLRCGASEMAMYDTWGEGFIPIIPQLLSRSKNEKNLANIVYPAYAQLKADGARAFAYVYADGRVEFLSRGANFYLNLTHVAQELREMLAPQLAEGKSFVVDGELVYRTDKADRQTGNGIANKALQGTISEEEASCMVYQVWDILPMEKYKIRGVVNVPYKTRYSWLCKVADKVSDRIQVIESHTVKSEKEAREVYREYVAKGYEGIILKNVDAPWEDTRSEHLVKFKEVYPADMKVLEYYEGEGKNAGMLGGLVISSACGKVVCNVGSGFSDAQRKSLWKKRDELIGMIVEVKHNGLCDNKLRPNVFALYLPIFKKIRKDKNDANDFETISATCDIAA